MALSFLLFILFFTRFLYALRISIDPGLASGLPKLPQLPDTISVDWFRDHDDPPNLKIVLCNQNCSERTVLGSLNSSNSSTGTLQAPALIFSPGYSILAINATNITDVTKGKLGLVLPSAPNIRLPEPSATISIPVIGAPVVIVSSMVASTATTGTGQLDSTQSVQVASTTMREEIIDNNSISMNTLSPSSTNQMADSTVAQPTGTVVVLQGCVQDRCTTSTLPATQIGQISPSLSFVESNLVRSTVQSSEIANPTATPPPSHFNGSDDGVSDPDSPSHSITSAKVSMTPPMIAGIVIGVTVPLIIVALILRKFCTKQRAVYSSLNSSAPHDNDSPEGDDPEKATGILNAERNALERKRARKYKGTTWKRISPFELTKSGPNGKRSWLWRRSGPRENEDHFTHFDPDALVSRRSSRPASQPPHDSADQVDSSLLRVEVEKAEPDEVTGEEGIDDKELRSIVETSGVTMSPFWSFSRDSGRIADERTSTASTYGSDFKSEDGSFDRPPALSIATRLLHQNVSRGGLTTSAASSPTIASPASGLRTETSLIHTDPDSILSPSESMDTMRSEIQQLREEIRRLVDHTESGWATFGYQEPLFEERPPDYANVAGRARTQPSAVR
ncbi:hypothetical protein Moror_14096 [Moniliophthora roreri MCA 2997]|uniref:Mid2 domain-containing protein n=1 Tax=Moniliophthora roreri (strain MCA 2997) TaxID=1381753 RepID=V2YTC5_MONRO|nr:hypothetical protein Moror_14096 [Moniliophthora roreri MCA 2997]KAI3619638.1 hypothetical protein WG66_002797 [Moniliophthora roreri]